MKNPFSHSGIVTGEAFCNRVQEIKDLSYLVNHSQNILLYSHRRMGKTSLIHQLILKLKKQRPAIQSVYVDLYGSIDEKDFIEAVFTGLAQIESKVEKLLKLASGLRLSSSIDPLTGQPSVSVSMSPKDRPRYLENAMNALAGYSAKRRLLLVFDEFQEIGRYTEDEFEKRLRSHIQKHSNISYIFSGSQTHLLARMFNTSDRAFYQMAVSFPLKSISMADYIEWASTLFKKRGVDLDKEVIQDIVERCDFQPMYIQQFLFELYRLEAFEGEIIDPIELKILERRENEFMILWDSLTINQRKVMRLLAETGGENMYYAEALQRVGLKSGSMVKRAINSLLLKEIVAKNKVYHIQDAMLKKWVSRKAFG
jgi:AAA+ ATPase superfamily predicted ATPase